MQVASVSMVVFLVFPDSSNVDAPTVVLSSEESDVKIMLDDAAAICNSTSVDRGSLMKCAGVVNKFIPSFCLRERHN